MNLFGIELVPFNVPFKHRVHVLASGTMFSMVALLGLVTPLLFLYLVLFTRYWWLVPLYLPWLYLDRHTPSIGGRPNTWLLSSKWFTLVREYLQATTVIPPDLHLDPKKNYLLLCFPHGVMPSGPPINIFSRTSGFCKKFPNFNAKFCGLDLFFYIPILHDFILAISGISSSVKSLNYVLGDKHGGNVVVLHPGGAEEASYAIPGMYKFVIKKRKGFVKIAIKNGSPLVPVITFNENDLFGQLQGPWVKRFQQWIKKVIGIYPVFFLGRGFFQYSFGVAPRQEIITTVVGMPIPVTKCENPSKEQIEELHEIFVKALTELFEKNKTKYAKNKDAVLELL